MNLPAYWLSLRFAADAGTFEEADVERGYAHLIEHMAFRSTRSTLQRGSTGVRALGAASVARVSVRGLTICSPEQARLSECAKSGYQSLFRPSAESCYGGRWTLPFSLAARLLADAETRYC